MNAKPTADSLADKAQKLASFWNGWKCFFKCKVSVFDRDNQRELKT